MHLSIHASTETFVTTRMHACGIEGKTGLAEEVGKRNDSNMAAELVLAMAGAGEVRAHHGAVQTDHAQLGRSLKLGAQGNSKKSTSIAEPKGECIMKQRNEFGFKKLTPTIVEILDVCHGDENNENEFSRALGEQARSEPTLREVIGELELIKNILLKTNLMPRLERRQKWSEEEGANDSEISRPWERTTLADAAADSRSHVGGTVVRWLVDKGLGLSVVQRGKYSFTPADCEATTLAWWAQKLVMKIMADPSRGPGKFRAIDAWAERDFEAELAIQRMEETARQAAAAAAEANKRAEVSRDAAERVTLTTMTARLMRPPGLEPRRSVETATQTTTESTMQSTSDLSIEDLVRSDRGCLTAVFRAGPTSEVSEPSARIANPTNASLIGDALDLYIENGGEDREGVRKNLSGMKPLQVRQYCEKLRSRIADKRRVKDQKEMLWEHYRRGRLTRRREQFEQEYRKQMPDTFYHGSSGERFDKERERKLGEWTSELKKERDKADRGREARERQSMEHADRDSRRQYTDWRLKERLASMFLDRLDGQPSAKRTKESGEEDIHLASPCTMPNGHTSGVCDVTPRVGEGRSEENHISAKYQTDLEEENNVESTKEELTSIETPNRLLLFDTPVKLFTRVDETSVKHSVSSGGHQEFFMGDDERSEVYAVSTARVRNKVETFLKKYELDDAVREKFAALPPEGAEAVAGRELSKRVRNPSAYVSKVLREAAKAHETATHESANNCAGTDWYDPGEAEHDDGEAAWRDEAAGGDEHL